MRPFFMRHSPNRPGPSTPAPQGATWWGEVEAGAEYAAYVEHGTSRQRPQPFMRPAYEQARDVWVQMIEQTGGRVL